MATVTILMAVYNAEKFLHKSLGSLIHQTFSDIQIICIDDASKDSSLQILMDYASKDARIEVLHLKENHGQAYARNMGIAKTTGKYICSIDADDWLADDALEKAVKVFENFPETDSVLFNIQYMYPDRHQHGYAWHFTENKYPTFHDGSFQVMSGYDAFIESLGWGIHGWSINNAELFRQYPYDDTCRFYSDDNTSHIHYLHSREVRCCSGIYYYRQNSQSTTHHVGIGRMDWMEAANSMRHQLEVIGMKEDVLCLWEWKRWEIVIDCYWFYFLHWRDLSAGDRQYCKEKIKKAWEGVDLSRLKDQPIYKLGWYPFPHHWRLFSLMEVLYFRMRYLLGRR